GPLAAFLSGWVTFLLGFAAPAAASANTAATYLIAPLHLTGQAEFLAKLGVGTFAILAFALIHTSSRSRTTRVQVTITLVKLALLVALIVAGVAVGWKGVGNLNDRPPVDFAVAVPMMFSLVYITYAYFGWNAASYLAGEVPDPGRQLPRAIMLGTGSVV